jgi:hypothetical protein
MTDLLFDTPWWLPAIIAVAGLTLFWTGNRQQKSGPRNVGLALLALTIALIAVSWLVDTQKDKCIKQATAIIHAAEKQDEPGLRALLGERTSVNNRIHGADAIAAAAVSTAGLYDLESLHALSTTAKQIQTVITVQMRVLAQSKSYRPTTVDCEFQWNQTSDGWHLQNIEVKSIGNQDVNRYLDRLGR